MTKKRRQWQLAGAMAFVAAVGDIAQQMFSGSAASWTHAMVAGAAIGALTRGIGAALARVAIEEATEQGDEPKE